MTLPTRSRLGFRFSIMNYSRRFHQIGVGFDLSLDETVELGRSLYHLFGSQLFHSFLDAGIVQRLRYLAMQAQDNIRRSIARGEYANPENIFRVWVAGFLGGGCVG